MSILKVKNSGIKTLNAFRRSFLILVSVLLLIALLQVIIPKSFYGELFRGVVFLDALTGSLIGSIAAGNPLTSYVIGGELLVQGVGLIAVTAFMVAWVTVGVVQLPAESLMLGKKFAVSRNLISFFGAILVALLTVYTLTFL